MSASRYKQLVDQLAAQIHAGQLEPGTRLPTHRQLAKEHNMALVTASRVYAELEKMGLVSGETGRGTFVRDISVPAGHGVDQQPVADGMLDLNFNSPSLPSQTQLLRNSLRELSLAGDLEALLHYQPHAGRRHERAIVAEFLKCRGLQAKAGQVLIVSGAQHGLACTVMGLLNPGDVVAADALIYPGFKVVSETRRLELTPLALGRDCPDLDTLEAVCQRRKVRAVYAMPTLHNPMGWVLDLAWRERLVKIARQYDLLIIEDAAYALHVEDAPPPLATLAPERTVYVSGLSKSVATGLRFGFVVAPSQKVAAIERVIRATTWNTPALVTRMACQWITDGTVAQLEAEKRSDAMQRQQIAKQILQGVDYISHPASYLIWLPLPEEARADQIVTELLAANISVSTAEPYATTEHVPHALRLALGSVALEDLPQALQKVRDIVSLYIY